MKESLKRFSEKNEVFSELYVQSPFLFIIIFVSFFFFPLTILFTIFHSTYVLCYSYTFLCLLFSFVPRRYIAFNIYNLYLSVL